MGYLALSCAGEGSSTADVTRGVWVVRTAAGFWDLLPQPEVESYTLARAELVQVVRPWQSWDIHPGPQADVGGDLQSLDSLRSCNLRLGP